MAIACVLAALALAAGCGRETGSRNGTSAPTSTAPAPTRVTSSEPTPGTRSPSPPPPTQIRHLPSLVIGDAGPAVRRAQQRLVELGYWLGAVDGRYGPTTEQAVLALQKAAGLERDGVLGPHTRHALVRGVRPDPRSTAGTLVEIDLARQLLLLVRDGDLQLTFNTSTGSGAQYWSEGATHTAITPVGRFEVYREVDGDDVSPLGHLWRPKYFTGGIAIHGYDSVPAYPASHGCVRVSRPAMDHLWDAGLVPLGTAVWVY